MDVTIVCSGEEETYKMEIGFFDKVLDIKEKLQKYKGYPVPTQTLFCNGEKLADDSGGTEQYGILEGSVIHVVLANKKKVSSARHVLLYWVKVTSMCGERSIEMEVDPRGAVSELRKELERVHADAGFPLPGEGAYFFIHSQFVLDEKRSFLWHDVEPGDEIVVFKGWINRSTH